MTDDELKQYIERYGDRLALRAFCRQGTETKESGVKPSLIQRVRDRLREREQLKTSADNGTAAGPSRKVGNSYATKDNRRIEMGWLHYDKVDFHQVRTKHGGGTRHLTVEKTVTMEELLEIGKGLFFPNGQSSKGLVEGLQFNIRDFSHNPVPLESTVSQLYDQTKLRMLRIYTCSRQKDQIDPEDVSILLSDTSSDFEPTKESPMKVHSYPSHFCY